MKIDLDELLKGVEKPGRYIGGEWNEKRKNPHRVKAKVALVFPDLYEIGMSYLGQKILYSLLNDHPSILAERVFAPWIDFEKKLRTKKIPLYSLENKIPLSKFDILGFSLLYELNYSNILSILDLGSIPFLSSDRTLEYPLLIAGGPSVFNPEPVADIFDVFFIGDGEGAFIEIIEKYITLKKETREKSEVLKELANIEGVYVPCFYSLYKSPKSFLLAVKPTHDMPTKIQKRVLFPFHKAPFPEKIVVPNIHIIFDRVAVEVARGCSQKCRFCQASNIYFPPRMKSPSFIMDTVLSSLRLTGYEDASLASLSISDYPHLEKIVELLMENLEKQKVSLSLSSLRPKGLSSEVARNITKVRKTGFTLVPEAGTERLRRVINKRLKHSEILMASQNAFSQGWRLLKLYFMVGLPTERDEDLEGIVRLVEEIIGIGRKITKTTPHINLSVSSFIPKPHTPFQWLQMEEEKILREKHKFIMSRLKKYPSIRFKRHLLKSSILEAIFSRGDRRLNQVLLQAWKMGARFDSWNDLFNFHFWEMGFQQEKIDYHSYLSCLGRGDALPWDHIDTGVKKSFLLKELDKAFKEELTLSCEEKKCVECQGCTLWPLPEKEPAGTIKIQSKDYCHFGKKTNEVLRYRIFYSKLQRGRYLSQIDLNSIVQRSFRRSGVSVVHSSGFHPKMLISYPPALPLGMEGKGECFEFKSQFLFDENVFIPHMNKSLPSGIRFLRLHRVKNFSPSLNEEIETLVYSVDLKSKEVKEALSVTHTEKDISSFDDFRWAEKLIDEFLAKTQNDFIERIIVERKLGKLFLYVKHSPKRSIRPQEFVENIFKIKNPNFIMAREEILFK